jgi:hypothetical protein
VFVLTFVVVMIGITLIPTLLSLRILTALPAIMLRASQGTLARSWQATRGSTWRIAIGMLVITIPAFLLFSMIPSLVSETSALPWSDPFKLAVVGLGALGELITSWFSLAYVAFCAKHFQTAGNGTGSGQGIDMLPEAAGAHRG